MSKLCCGEICETRFCPNCGAEIGSPLTSLYQHVKRHEQQAAKDVEHREKGLVVLDSDYRDSYSAERERQHRQTRLKVAQTCLSKWRDWAECLEQILEKGK